LLAGTMSAPLKKKKDLPPEHRMTSWSMIAFTCNCGGRWMNENLKGKKDEDLILEVQEAFARHEREMEDKGF